MSKFIPQTGFDGDPIMLPMPRAAVMRLLRGYRSQNRRDRNANRRETFVVCRRVNGWRIDTDRVRFFIITRDLSRQLQVAA